MGMNLCVNRSLSMQQKQVGSPVCQLRMLIDPVRFLSLFSWFFKIGFVNIFLGSYVLRPEKGKGKPGQFGSSPRDWYSGWACMKSLITKGLAVKSSCPAKYGCTIQYFSLFSICNFLILLSIFISHYFFGVCIFHVQWLIFKPYVLCWNLWKRLFTMSNKWHCFCAKDELVMKGFVAGVVILIEMVIYYCTVLWHVCYGMYQDKPYSFFLVWVEIFLGLLLGQFGTLLFSRIT